MIDFEEKLDEYKQEYMDAIQKFTAEETSSNLISCMRKGNKYFNFAEKSIAKTKVDGLHNDGLFVIDLAESCYSILESYIYHLDFIKSKEKLLGSEYKQPQFIANNMQRMIKQYLPKERLESIRNLFIERNLSTEGFDMKAPNDKKESIIPFIIAIIFMGVPIVALMFFISTPNPHQFFIFRVFIALGGASIATYIPGWLNINIKAYNNKIKAGGAIAVFILLYLFTPDLLQ